MKLPVRHQNRHALASTCPIVWDMATYMAIYMACATESSTKFSFTAARSDNQTIGDVSTRQERKE